MKTAPPTNTVDFFTSFELHQLWQAIILKPLKLEECILHIWKSPIFINVFPTRELLFQYLKIHPKDSWFHTSRCSSGVYLFLGECTCLEIHFCSYDLPLFLWRKVFQIILGQIYKNLILEHFSHFFARFKVSSDEMYVSKLLHKGWSTLLLYRNCGNRTAVLY